MHNREVPATAIIFVMRADRLIVYRDTLFLHNHRHHLLFPYFPSPRPERVGEVCFGKLSREPAPGKGAQRCFGPLQNRRLKPAKCDAVFKRSSQQVSIAQYIHIRTVNGVYCNKVCVRIFKIFLFNREFNKPCWDDTAQIRMVRHSYQAADEGNALYRNG